MRKLCERSFRFLLSTVLILNTFVGLRPVKVSGVSFDGGSGTPEDPYIISTAEQLDAVRDNLSASYKLVKDIDLKDYLDQNYSTQGWQPIGYGDKARYSGIFDGCGHKVKGVWINRPDENFVGFFSYIGNSDIATVKNLNVELDNKGVVGHDYTGGFIGCSYGNMMNCSVTGGPVSGFYRVGKFIGENNTLMINCYAAGDKIFCLGDSQNRSSMRIGGFAGSSGPFDTGALIENCFSTCDVESEGKQLIGGFVGCQRYGTVRKCYTSGNVNLIGTGDTTWVGGFIGFGDRNAFISDCYATGNVLGTYKYIAGFAAACGRTDYNSIVQNCYACCEEVGCTKEFLGLHHNSDILRCYYDKDKGIKKDCEGRDLNSTLEVYGKTTEEMKKKETYEGWDFDTVWDIKEGEEYPYLRSSLPLYYSFGPRSAVYNGSVQNVEITKNECGEAAGAGNATSVTYSGPGSKPVKAGEYDIAVNLSAGFNTNAATNIKLLGSYVIEKAELTLEHFKYDLSSASYEGDVERPVVLSAKPGTAFTDEINDLINNGKIWVEYKTNGGDWTKNVPINAATYEVRIVVGSGATNFKPVEMAIGSMTVDGFELDESYFNYDLSPVSYEEGIERPVILSAKSGTAFTDEINDLINNGKIWLEYKTNGGDWTKNAPINATTYEVKIVVGAEATNFKTTELAIGNYLIGEKRSIIYKNYDGSDITELDASLPTEYIEGTEVAIPQTVPNSEMSDWDFLGYWDCALDNSQDSLIDLEGTGYENEKSLDFEKGKKVELIPKDSKGNITVFARYTSKMFDADINGRENYIFASPGVFPNGVTASMRVLTPGTEEYEKTLNDVDKKDKHNVKIVEFEVFDKNGEKIQPKTFFGDTVIGFRIPENFEIDDTSLVKVTSGEDINLRSNIWSDPENPELKYIEGTTDHFSPYAILSPWSDFLDAQERDFSETGEANWVLILCVVSFIIVIATVSVIIYKKRNRRKKFNF